MAVQTDSTGLQWLIPEPELFIPHSIIIMLAERKPFFLFVVAVLTVTRTLGHASFFMLWVGAERRMMAFHFLVCYFLSAVEF